MIVVLLRCRQATDRDTGLNAVVVYKLSAQSESLYGHLFALNNDTGDIVVRSPPDREQFAVIQLTVIAYDLGPDSLPSDTSVIIHVDDINDNSPEITINTLPASSSSSSSAASGSESSALPVRRRTQSGSSSGRSRLVGGADVLENLAPGAFVAYVSVNDPDFGDSGRVDCDVNDDATFSMLRRHDREYKVHCIGDIYN